jgi:hypothetical protein
MIDCTDFWVSQGIEVLRFTDVSVDHAASFLRVKRILSFVPDRKHCDLYVVGFMEE